MPKVNFVNEKKTVDVEAGANLRKEALKHGIGLYPHIHKIINCHGLGQCGTCRVLITKGMGHTNERTTMEKLRLGMSFAYIGHEDTMRLSCQTKVQGDIDVVTKPPLNLYGENFFS